MCSREYPMFLVIRRHINLMCLQTGFEEMEMELVLWSGEKNVNASLLEKSCVTWGV